MARRYQKTKKLLPEIEQMLATGKTQREVAKHLGLKGDRPIHDLLAREQRKLRQEEVPNRIGRRRSVTPQNKKQYEKRIEELERDNELLRSFLHAAGRM